MFEIRKLLAVTCLLAVAFFCGCELNGTKKQIEPSPQPAEPADDAASATRPAVDQPVMAKVNGRPISMNPLQDVLIQDYGLAMAQQLIADELVRQELVRQNLPYDVTDKEMGYQTKQALYHILQWSQEPNEEQMDTLLRQYLSKNNYTRRQWDTAMLRNVRLGRLAAKRVEVTEDDLRNEFYARYDGKLRVRHIQVPNLQQAQKALQELENGSDFAKVAQRYSTNPSGKKEFGGFLPDIGTRVSPDGIPDVIVKVARELKTPGQLSNPVQVGTNFHILKLEEIVPPKNATFDAVKDSLRPIVREKKVQALQAIIMQELIKNGKIEYVNPILREQEKRRSTP